MKNYIILSCLAVLTMSCISKESGKHLFILSGQSNMKLLKPKESFTPIIEAEFGKEQVIIVKDAQGSKPIRNWYKAWQSPIGNEPKADPFMYEALMAKVNRAIENQSIASVTFVWMQGERDAKKKFAEVYEESLMGLYKQLSDDLGRQDINFVIGRLSDFDMKNENYQHWTRIRDIQMKVANSNSRFDWVNTDDLNDGTDRKGRSIKNDLHMSAKGYVLMGERFAEKSIALLKKAE